MKFYLVGGMVAYASTGLITDVLGKGQFLFTVFMVVHLLILALVVINSIQQIVIGDIPVLKAHP